ncbi:MAG TPA: hypothetical protein VJ373_01865 [Desulfatiglandales bacterium]|nr:hypothetical protein [Desulfatiglandales bacterium]
MSYKFHGLPLLYLLIGSVLTLILILNINCQFRGGGVKGYLLPPRTGKTVVLGFRPAMPEGKEASVLRNPISGAVFMAEPIPADAAYKMTAKLFNLLRNYEGYELVDLDKEAGISAGLLSSGQGISDIETFKRIGHEFYAETVMVGYIYRWHERKGTDYSADRPASTAFDLYLLRAEDGVVLWKGKYDKTQAPLSENIGDIRTFLRGKGKWMTVEALADLGLSDILGESFPDAFK